MNLAFTNPDPAAEFWSTYLQEVPWNNDSPPAYSELVGFRVDMIQVDLLHALNLGVGRDVAGSILRTILSERHIFPQGTIDERLQAATLSLRQFCRTRSLPLRMKRLTKKKLGWSANTYSELRTGSGYDNSVVMRWLEDLLKPFAAVYGDYCSMLWAINLSCHILYEAGWFLTHAERARVRAVGRVFMTLFLKQAAEAAENHQFMWRVKPKLHELDHVFNNFRLVNPARYSTWMDEDFLRRISKTLRLTSAVSAQKRTLQRWLLALPTHIRKSLERL